MPNEIAFVWTKDICFISLQLKILQKKYLQFYHLVQTFVDKIYVILWFVRMLSDSLKMCLTSVVF